MGSIVQVSDNPQSSLLQIKSELVIAHTARFCKLIIPYTVDFTLSFVLAPQFRYQITGPQELRSGPRATTR